MHILIDILGLKGIICVCVCFFFFSLLFIFTHKGMKVTGMSVVRLKMFRSKED